MKKNFGAMLLLTSFVAYSQTGLNTPSPSAALDIVSKGNSDTTKALEINDNTNKELVSVADSGKIRLGSYKNYNFLGTDANGYLKDGSVLNIPTITAIASRSANSGSNNGNVNYDIVFTLNKINSDFLSYNNAIFTVKKAGYYSITAYTHYFIDLDPNATDGTAQTKIYKGNTSISETVTWHQSGTDTVGHTTTITEYFNVNETFRINVVYTRQFRTDKASLNVVYYGT